jgi:hypothetical protein
MKFVSDDVRRNAEERQFDHERSAFVYAGAKDTFAPAKASKISSACAGATAIQGMRLSAPTL